MSLPQQTVWANPQLIKHPLEVATALAGPLGARPRRHHRARREAAAATPSSPTSPAASTTRWPPPIAELELPGVAFLEEPERIAPAGDLARSVLGQVGVDNDGLSGLEKQYDDALTGEPGELVIEKDPDGRTIPGGEHQRVPAQRGDDLVLTIDRSMQYETERALAAQILAKGAKGGTAIVSRPGDRRDPRAGQLHHRPRDRRHRRHRQQHGRDGGVRARLGEQGDHRGRRPRGGAGDARTPSSPCPTRCR